jgi:RNase H-fold protein (predicted Holliday junction resolvase)
MLELNKVLNVVKRCSVQDAILAEISLISAKIDSLQVPTAVNPNKEPLWTEVVKGKKNTSPTQRRGPYNIPMINNRYNLLPLGEKCKDSETASLNVVQPICVTKTSNKKKTKIVILGESHARGCASEVQHNLDHTFEIQGSVKPGANLEGIVTFPTDTTTNLTKKDVVVIWGGTLDIGRNKSKKTLQQIRNFVQNHNQTNVIVMSAPYRHDLDSYSCVNKEVTVYNKKLKKYIKIFDNTQIVEVDPQREIYTRHGLHMNQNGKEQMAKKNCTDSQIYAAKRKI